MNTPSAPIRVLHVDDDPDFSALTAEFIQRQDERITVETASTVSEGLDRLADADIDCIVSDYDMPGRNGLDFLETVREADPDLPFILFTGKGSEEVASRAISAGAMDYLQKKTGASQYEVLANRIKNSVARHRAEQNSASTEARCRRLIEETSDVIVVVDADGTFEYLSPAAADVLGYRQTELVGENGLEYIHPDDRDDAIDQFCAVVEESEPRSSAEFRFEQQDGTWVWVEARIRNLLDDPIIGGLVVYARDITDRKEREQRLERYRTLVESVGDPMYVLDTDGVVQMVNQSMADLGGTTSEEVVGTHVSNFLDENDRQRGTELIRELLAESDRKTGTYEATIQPETGDPFPAEVNLGLILDDNDEFLGTAGVVHDLTEHKRRERKLERQIERLDEFAGVVSHDLRNPLNTAMGRLEMVREDCDSEHLDAIERAHERMNVLTDDLLSLARAGKSIQEMEPVALEEVAEACWRHTETKNAQLAIETDGTIRADEGRLRQLIENLLRNAVEHGGADVTITVGDLPDGFYVEDDGPGIPESERTEVFEAGYTTNRTGTGFGLSIVRDIADAHDWTVEITAGTDGGARFEFSDIHPE